LDKDGTDFWRFSSLSCVIVPVEAVGELLRHHNGYALESFLTRSCLAPTFHQILQLIVVQSLVSWWIHNPQVVDAPRRHRLWATGTESV
jgi:hypothetical protein